MRSTSRATRSRQDRAGSSRRGREATQPGYANGGNKFDLTQWDDAYFTRLKEFLSLRREKDVVVEVTLFCPMYEDMQWKLSPDERRQQRRTASAPSAAREVYTLDKNGGLLAVQEALMRKIVTELNGFDNVFFEICNEPYFGGVTIAWQHRIADVIVETERALPAKHLIAQNIANGSAKIEDPHPAVSIFNFHYATPPDAVAMNYALGKVIGDDETGFRGTADAAYRTEGVGLHPRRRRPLQQSRLLVRRRPGRRHLRLPGVPARWRQPGIPPAAEDPARLHQRVRLRSHEAGQLGDRRRRAAGRHRAGARRSRQGDGHLRPEPDRGWSMVRPLDRIPRSARSAVTTRSIPFRTTASGSASTTRC